MPELISIFDLRLFPAAILFAAIFGLAPSLLFDRLWGAVDQYRENLKSSEATSGSAVPAPGTPAAPAT